MAGRARHGKPRRASRLGDMARSGKSNVNADLCVLVLVVAEERDSYVGTEVDAEDAQI